jgi:hypothetical protein
MADCRWQIAVGRPEADCGLQLAERKRLAECGLPMGRGIGLICQLRSALCDLPTAICDLRSAFCDLWLGPGGGGFVLGIGEGGVGYPATNSDERSPAPW